MIKILIHQKVNRSYERNNNNTTNNNYNRPLPILNSNGTYNPYMNVVLLQCLEHKLYHNKVYNK